MSSCLVALEVRPLDRGYYRQSLSFDPHSPTPPSPRGCHRVGPPLPRILVGLRDYRGRVRRRLYCSRRCCSANPASRISPLDSGPFSSRRHYSTGGCPHISGGTFTRVPILAPPPFPLCVFSPLEILTEYVPLLHLWKGPSQGLCTRGLTAPYCRMQLVFRGPEDIHNIFPSPNVEREIFTSLMVPP